MFRDRRRPRHAKRPGGRTPVLPTTADTTRQLCTVWTGKHDWKAIYVGHTPPRGSRSYWRTRRLWQLHVTPVHASRSGDKWTAGLCFGRRTIYIASHR